MKSDIAHRTHHPASIAVIVGIAIVVGYFFYYKDSVQVHDQVQVTATVSDISAQSTPIASIEPKIPTHIATPQKLRAIYITGWTAGSSNSMKRITALLDATDINAIVVDIKDATGRLSYKPLDPELIAVGSGMKRIANLSALIESFHARGLYVIGRVAVFQDPYLAQKYPSYGYHTAAGDLWQDTKGIAWVRADEEHVWEYNTAIARDAYAQGFDEINLDYVRYPTDGALNAIVPSTTETIRTSAIEKFFTYMDNQLRGVSHIPLSADIFGLTMSTQGDMGIGQVLERVAPHVDYIAPMIYPSHFGKGNYGFAEPAKHPYEVIARALADGQAKLLVMQAPVAALRPWLQDFNLGAVYTPDMVVAQIKAAHDAGIDSWMMWNPANIYTTQALQ